MSTTINSATLPVSVSLPPSQGGVGPVDAAQRSNTSTSLPTLSALSLAAPGNSSNPASAPAEIPRRTEPARFELAAARTTNAAGRIPDDRLSESFQHAVRLRDGKFLYRGVVFATRAELQKFQAAEKAGRINPGVAATPPGAPAVSGGSLESRVLVILHKLNQKLSKAIEKQLKEVEDLADQVDKAVKDKNPAEALKTDLQTAMIGLNELMEQRKQAFDMASNMLKSLNTTSENIIRNIRP